MSADLWILAEVRTPDGWAAWDAEKGEIYKYDPGIWFSPAPQVFTVDHGNPHCLVKVMTGWLGGTSDVQSPTRLLIFRETIKSRLGWIFTLWRRALPASGRWVKII